MSLSSSQSSIYVDWQNAIQSRIVMEISRPFVVAHQILTNQSYLYPFKGLTFFIQNYKTYLPILLSVLIPYGILSCYIFTILLIAILPINLILNTLTFGPIGIEIGILNSFQQCNYINNYILKNYLINGKLNKTFDTTLCLVKLDKIVIPGKLKRLVPQTLVSQLMNINLINLFISILNIIKSIIISFIPIFGNIIIHYNNSIQIAADSQKRFWQLTRQRPRQITYHIKENEGIYLLFGFTCQLLENIPFFGLFFCFTNCIGAALLAADEFKITR